MFTDEKFFRLEQDDRQQRVWLDSVMTKKVCATLLRVTHLFRLSNSVHTVFSSVAPVEDNDSDHVISVSLEECRGRYVASSKTVYLQEKEL